MRGARPDHRNVGAVTGPVAQPAAPEAPPSVAGVVGPGISEPIEPYARSVVVVCTYRDGEGLHPQWRFLLRRSTGGLAV